MSIEITISGDQEFEIKTYVEPKDCYIARELKKLDYDNVSVGGEGHVRINDIRYEPTTYFNTKILYNNMSQNIDTHLVFEKLDQ